MKTRQMLTLTIVLTALSAGLPLRAASDDDARIVSAAKQSYVYRTYLKNDDIRIQSADGVVTLKGEVSDRTHKDMAADTVEGLPGVKRIENHIVVKGASEHSDGWIEFKVKSALLFHRSTSGTKTTLAVKDGVVTLSGIASSQAQKELTGEYARDIEGVKGVKNEMTVVDEGTPSRTVGEVIDDASITAQVKSALLLHHSTSAIKTKVSTKDGVVTLTGEAKNQAERDLVTKLASDIQGVKSVANNMEVKG
jgi:osmotically-inducible protein OsmY